MTATSCFWLLLSLLVVTAAFRLFSSHPRARWAHQLTIAVLLILPLPKVAPHLFGVVSPVEHLLIVDISRSMQEHPATLVSDAIEVHQARFGNAAPVVVAAGASAHIVESGNELSFGAALNQLQLRRGFDLRRALVSGLSVLSGDGPLHLAILTDRQIDRASVVSASALLSERNLEEVVVLPPRSVDTEDASVRFKTHPMTCRVGETLGVEVEVFGRVRKRRILRVRLDSSELELTLTPERTSVSLALLTAPMTDNRTSIEARLLGHDEWDSDASGDVARIPCHVQHEAPRVLVCTKGGPDLGAALRAQGAHVTEASELLSLSGQDIVVLENIAASAMSDSLSNSLDTFVRGGGGLILAGATSAFGKGAWSGTVLDELSPLKSRPDKRRLDVTLLLDRSGSMDRDGRFAAAKSAALAFTGHLGPRDQLKINAFGVTRTARRFRGGDTAAVSAWLRTLTPGGGTDLAAALDESVADGGESEGASEKVLMVLTDWEDLNALEPERLAKWTQEAQAARLSISVFWFDRDESRRSLLTGLTSTTRGSLIDVDDFGTLLDPMINVVDESLVLEPATIRSISGVEGAVSRLLRTSHGKGLRVLARHDASTAALASWSVGEGQVASIPVDLDARTIRALFGSDEAMASFVASLAEEGGGFSDSVALEAGKGRWRFIVRSGGNLSHLTTIGASHFLRRVGATTWASTWIETPPESGLVRLMETADKVRSVRPFQGPDPFDREQQQADWTANALQSALMGDSAGRRFGGLPALMLILAFLGCVTEVVARLNRR